MEFALALPLFLFTLLVCMQMALLVIADYNVKYVGHETARLLAVNPDTTDGALGAQVKSILLPGLDASLLTLTASPACPALSGGHCANRAPGDVVTVAAAYDASNLLFLPSTVSLGGLTFTFPAMQPSIQLSVMVE